MKKRALVPLLLAAAAFRGAADDGSWSRNFREASGPIYAETDDPDIVLESEMLRFTAPGTGETEAFFLFRNTSAREVRLEAGFPVRVRIAVAGTEVTLPGAHGPEAVLYPVQDKYRTVVDGLSAMEAFYGDALHVVKDYAADNPYVPDPLPCVRKKDALTRRMVPAAGFPDPFAFSIEQDGKQVDYDAVLLVSWPPSGFDSRLEMAFHFHHVLVFPPNAASVVRVAYFQDCELGTENRGYGFAVRYGWDYILGTGRTWKGSIGRLLLAVPEAAETDLPAAFGPLGTRRGERLFLAEDYEPAEEDEISLSWSGGGTLPPAYYESLWFGDRPTAAARPTAPAQDFVEVLGASSSLGEKTALYTAEGVMRDVDFSPLRAFDGVRESAWCEAAAGDGIGEWIEFRLEEAAEGLTVQNGFNMSFTAVEGRSIDTYYGRNNRVRSLEIASKDGTLRTEVKLADNPEPQKIDLPLPAGTYRLTIRSVYKGSQWSDTCLGEVTFHPVNRRLRDVLAQDGFLREHY